ncbi:MAG: cbb3-type cytochrome c oxidase subunit I, partial [Acidobacteria bacterium]|nr:cbb3-type cytochrome c oxidase subunit I [Acidobacteriota bacterium]
MLEHTTVHTTRTNIYPGAIGAIGDTREARAAAMSAAPSTIYSWMLISAALFVILVLLGIVMRLVQGGALPGLQSWFYPLMTLHGVGMAGLWFVGAMACASEAMRKHVHTSSAVGVLALSGTMVGVVLLLVSVFAGRFAAGWYFLYPLPLQGEWPAWSAVTFLVSLTVLGATWLVWSLDMLRAVAARYSLPNALGWHYLRGETEPAVPPAVIIVTVSMIVNVVALVAGVVTLVLFYFELLTGAPVDALLMKNLTFLFGHTLVNLALYLALAAVYEALPVYAGRPWKANKIVAISWNAVLFVVLLAYFHHLYMDFVQPGTLQ